MDVAHSASKLLAGAKNVLEVSLVCQGAREACFVTAYEEEGQQTRFRAAPSEQQVDAWASFDLDCTV